MNSPIVFRGPRGLVQRYSIFFLLSLSGLLYGQAPNSSPADSLAGQPGMLAVPAGTKVQMAVTRAVWAAKAKPGDPLYLETVFPVAVGSQIAIPAGTYVSATMNAIQPPTRKANRAQVEVHFQQIIFAGGYAVTLAGADGPAISPSPPAPSPPGGPPGTATVSLVTIQVSRANDLLLDNGSQIEMTLGEPLSLDAGRIARAVLLSRAAAPGSFKPATLCRPTPGDPGTPGTPGTPDTVIPGSPGTPDTVIPGPDGTSTVIPGTPATPDTVIPGTPGTPGTSGTPGTVCPAPPFVISSAPGGTISPSGVSTKQSPASSTNKTRIQDEKKGQL